MGRVVLTLRPDAPTTASGEQPLILPDAQKFGRHILDAEPIAPETLNALSVVLPGIFDARRELLERRRKAGTFFGKIELFIETIRQSLPRHGARKPEALPPAPRASDS